MLNSTISRILSYMRHGDCICIADCGLPCPENTELVDVSLRAGDPGFLHVLGIVLSDLCIEKITLAEEIKQKNPEVLEGVKQLLPSAETEFLPHAQLKEHLAICKAVIRTGENTPFANIILHSACLF